MKKKLLKPESKIKPSGTISLYDKVELMKDAGADIILLAVGELEIDSPESAKNAGIKAIQDNFTRYTMTNGIWELRQAVAAYLHKQTNSEFSENNILITNGCKQATYNLLVSILKRSDEVIIPAPYYTSHPIQIELAGGKPVLVRTKQENNYQLSKAILNKALTSKTKAMLITSPQNPTGAVYTLESLKIIADFVIENDLWLISDEIYSGIVYPPFRFESILKNFPKLKERMLIANGFSKSFAMTGWRIGYAAGPEEIIKTASNVHANTTSNVCSISQKAALACLNVEPDYSKTFMSELTAKRDYALKIMNSIAGIQCREPQGAFYLFPNVKSFFGKRFETIPILSSASLANYLLMEHGVAIVPGEAFGAPGYIRISYAVDRKTLEQGLARIKKGLELLK